MNINYKFCELLSIITLLAYIIPTLADDKQTNKVFYSLPAKTSLDARGLVIVLLHESPDDQTTPPGRHIATDCFQITKIGVEPTHVAGGISGDDRFSVSSTCFDRYILGVYITEKGESITVVNEGLEYYIEASPPWGKWSKQRLVNFATSGLPMPQKTLTPEIRGTLANHDILVTLRDSNPDRERNTTCSFVFDAGPNSRGAWTRAPNSASTGETATEWFDKHHTLVGFRDQIVAPSKKSPATQDSESDGDLMRAVLLDQRNIGPDTYLLTVMAESPLANEPGRRKAFYYFLQNAADGSDMQYVSCVTSKDTQAVGSGTANDPAAYPTGTLSGSVAMSNAELSLAAGPSVLHFQYDNSAKKWVGR